MTRLMIASRTVRTTMCAAIALAAVWTGGALANDARPQHYEAAKPATPGEARGVLSEALKDIEAAFKAGDFERIHQVSYSAENAAAVLAADAGFDPGLSDRLRHTIEIVHLASEIPDKAILEAAVPGLRTVTGETLAGN